MDGILDPQRFRDFDCKQCTAAIQKQRNCSGKGEPKKIMLNQRIYPRCPRAIWIESRQARFLASLYIDCRESRILPEAGCMADQTAYTKELFELFDGMVSEKRKRDHDKQMAEIKAARNKKR